MHQSYISSAINSYFKDHRGQQQLKGRNDGIRLHFSRCSNVRRDGEEVMSAVAELLVLTFV